MNKDPKNADAYTRLRLNSIGHAMRDSRLPYLTRATFVVRVTDYTSREIFDSTGLLKSWVGRETLALELGTKADRIREADRLLCECGYMSLDRAGGGLGRTNHYSLTIFAAPAERKTPRKRGAMADENPLRSGGEQAVKTPLAAGVQTPPGFGVKPPANGGGKPLTQPSEDETRFAVSDAQDEEIEGSITRIIRAFPKASLEGSSADLVKSAVLQLVAEGLEHRALALAVETFCRVSHLATEDRGRWMGGAHRWLLQKRGGWEAHWPTAEGVFIDALAGDERAWLRDVRQWQRRPSDWQASWGPRPNQAGCRAPAKILTFCGITPPPLAEAS